MLYVLRFDISKGCGTEFMKFARRMVDFWKSVGVAPDSVRLFSKGVGGAQSRTVLIEIESFEVLDKAFNHPGFEEVKRDFRRITENLDTSVILEVPL